MDSIESILVVGPNAEAINHSISRYGPSNIDVISIHRGIKELVGDKIDVKYAKGCDFFDDNWPENELFDMPPSGGQQALINEAVQKAESVDLVIVAVGDDEATVGESRSRTSLNLPGNQLDLVKALHKTGKSMVGVLVNGRPLSINWMDRNIPAIVEAWFPGEYGGQAIAEVLFGKYNPEGKLPVTFPRSVGQIPLNFPYKPSAQAGQPSKGPNGFGKTRVNDALYPFGYGLSYTSFEYENLNVETDNLNDDIIAKVSATIKNTGKVKGDEVVQLYFSDKVSSVTVYVKQLRGFERITLEPGESKTVEFELSSEDLSLYNKNMDFVMEPGEFEFMLGSSFEDIRLKQNVEIK